MARSNDFGRISTVATTTKVSVSLNSTSVLSANVYRKGFIVVNDSDEVIYLDLSDTAVLNEGTRLNSSGGSYTDSDYEGAVSAICASGNKNLTVTEKL